MTLLGYARVSRVDQNPDLQRQALTTAGCERIWEDRVSGKVTARPALTEMLSFLRSGDVMVVWKLDRLGRSLGHLVAVLTTLQERGVEFRSLTEGIDTTTPLGRFAFHLAGAMAEMERELIRERTVAGLAAAKERGRSGGGSKRLSLAQVRWASERVLGGQTAAQTARELGVHRSTLHRALVAGVTCEPPEAPHLYRGGTIPERCLRCGAPARDSEDRMPDPVVPWRAVGVRFA